MEFADIFEKIFSGDFSAFVPLFYLIIAIAIYSIIIFHFYRFIARRDCLGRTENCKHKKTVSFLKFFFLYPFVAAIFFMGFSTMMIFLTKDYPIGQILSTAFAVVVSIRITAYYTEELSKDVAKMLPFALLGVYLVDPSYFRFEDVINRLYSIPNWSITILQFVLFMILVEWILRILLNIKQYFFPKKEVITEEQN